jgi:uncharacterized protein
MRCRGYNVNRGNLRLALCGEHRGGDDQRAGGWRWTDYIPAANAGRRAGDRRCHKRGRLALCVSHAVWRTRGQLAGVLDRKWLWLLLIPSVLGGLLGALLLSRTGERNFVEFVPWLVVSATVIILLRPILVGRRESDSKQPQFAAAWWPILMAIIFVVALYGGYFGAGIGILMIGALSFISPGDIQHVVALKNLLTGCLRGMAVIVLIIEGNVDWKFGVPMALGGLVGGYIGGLVSHRANRVVVRWIVIAIGFGVAAYYFWKLYGPAFMRVGGE